MNRLREQLSQLIIIGIRGYALTAGERLLMEEYGFGGVILFQHNCAEPRQTLSLCRDLWSCAGESPPLIAIDHEGGRVHRLPEPFTRFPAAALLGATRNPDLVYRAGRAAALELALAGINLNFAPVLDVNSNPRNPVIGDRAFACKPDGVVDMGLAWARGLGDGGVIPCGKHFPGHGDTDKDSHFDLPRVEKSLDELRALEFIPFAQASKARLAALMTGHVVYPALDPLLPATLSGKIVTGLLRHQFGFDGVVFSDDLEMKAIADRFGHREAALLALHAGVDVVLFCHEQSKAVEVFEFLCDEAEKEPALRARIEQSRRRIGELKRRFLGAFRGAPEDELAERLGKLDHRRLIEEIHGSL